MSQDNDTSIKKVHLMKQHQRGSVLLFISAIVIPFLFFTLSLGLDVAMFFHEKRRAQTLLDQAGLHVQRFLPYVPEAQAAFDSFIEDKSLLQQGVSTLVYHPDEQVSDIITLRYERPFTPFFANLIASNLAIQLVAESQIRTNPFNIHIAVDTSSYMAPSIDDPLGWSPDTEVPASLFGQGILNFAHDLNGDHIAEMVNPLVASQQCFSRPLRTAKRNAIRLYQYVSSFRDNMVGLSAYPSGSGGFLDILQPVSLTLIPGTHPNPNQFQHWSAPFVRNEDCAAASEQEVIRESFQVPLAHESFVGLWRASSSGEYLIDPAAGWEVNPFFQEISGEVLLWSQAVRAHASADTPEVIRAMSLSLLALDDAESRGGVRGKAVRQAIVFGGDLPWSQGERFMNHTTGMISDEVSASLTSVFHDIGNLVATYEDLNFHLFYITFFHEGLSGTADQFSTGIDAVQVLADSVLSQLPEDVQERLTFRFIGTGNSETVSDELLSLIAMNRRSGVIAR